jgi:hypothetical protein
VFSDNFYFEDVDFEQKILSRDMDYLTEDEKLPDWILNWLAEDKTKIKFLKENGLKNHNSIINFRKNFKEERGLKHKTDELFINSTLEWIFEKGKELNSKAEYNLKELIKNYSREYKRVPDYVVALGVSNNNEIVKVLDEFDNDACYIRNYSDTENQIIELMQMPDFDYQIIDNSSLSVDKEVFDEINVEKLVISPQLDQDNISNAKEWDKEYYQQWRKTDSGKKYQIYFLDNDVPLNYIACIGDDEYELDWVSGGDLSNIKPNKHNDIYISQKYIDSEENHILVIFEEKKKDIEFEAADLLSLNSFYIEYHEQRNKQIEEANLTESELDIIKNNREYFNRFISGDLEGGDGTGNVTLDKDLTEEEQKKLNDLINKYSVEEIEELIRKAEALSEDDAEVNSLTGLIGEYAFWAYLDEKKRKVEYTADKEPAYDFIVDGNVLVDTKTTVRPVRGNADSVPFYIKPNQYQYMMQNQPENYYIVRLSIEDLGLQSLRSKYIDLKGIDSKAMPENRKKALMKDIQEFYKTPRNQQKLTDSKMAFKLGRDSFFD